MGCRTQKITLKKGVPKSGPSIQFPEIQFEGKSEKTVTTIRRLKDGEAMHHCVINGKVIQAQVANNYVELNYRGDI